MSDSSVAPSTRTMGPSLSGTLIAADVDAVAASYCQWLDMRIADDAVVSAEQASGWGMAAIAQRRCLLLASTTGAQWLRIIHDPDAQPAQPIANYGWMSLEVLVGDVFRLAEGLRASPFRFIGEPKTLDISDSISACQVVGLAGEVLYLTTVGEVTPPFELPTTEATLDRLLSRCWQVPAAQP